MLMRALGIAAATLLSSISVQAAYTANGPNVFYYWGQNSAGGASTQGSLASYCNSGQVDALLLSFLHVFNVGGLPGINLSNACETNFPGTTLLTCPAIGDDIKTCQEKGVKIILSLGGAAGSYGLSSDAEAQTFAQTIWDMFGGGTHKYRPFGDSVIDGVDLDIEGGPSTGYASFVTAVRSKFGSSGFLVGAAPQCPFPDVILGSVINAVGFDYVNVQFYNNYCSVAGNSFNFDTWADWAKTKSPNKNVKVYLTVPGSSSAAGSGYAPISTIQNIVPKLASQYSGNFGGVSVWDASQAWANADFASQIYSLVKGSGGGGNGSSTIATTTKSTTAITSSTSANSSVSATSTKTTSSAIPTSTSNPTTCPAAGQACTTDGKYVCTTGGAYAACVHGKWSLTSCPSGTSCIPTTDGGSIYCGYSSGSSSCPSVNACEIFLETLNKGGAVPKPYKASQVAAQLTVSNTTTESFEAVINARRITAKPFEKLVTIEFTAPANIKFNEVGSGSIRQVGNKVRIQAQNTYNTSMSLVIDVKGSINSDVFVAPNPASLRFK